MILKLGTKHQGENINHDPGMSPTYFTAWSTWVAHTFEREKNIKMSFEGKNLKEMGKWSEDLLF